MKSEQIDQLCRDWLIENYEDEIASEYMVYSLVIPSFNSKQLNDALEELRLILCNIYGQERSFGAQIIRTRGKDWACSEAELPYLTFLSRLLH